MRHAFSKSGMALKSVALLVGLVAMPATTLADTSSIEVVMNQAKIVKLARPDGQPVVDEQVVVSRQTVDSVRIYRRANVQTLSCTPYCESAYKTEAERLSEAELNSSQ